MNDAQLLRYSRHLLLEGWSEQTQERVMRSRVLIVGAGGLGSAAVMYLAAAGVGTLMVMDPDCIELSNLQRQVAYRTAWVGQGKAASTQWAAADLNPDVKVMPLPIAADDNTLLPWLQQADVVIDCTDRWSTRHMINRACVRWSKPLVFGAALRHEAQLSVFDTRNDQAPCYACLFPDDMAPRETSCAVMGVFAPLVGMIGAAQAAECLKLITGLGQTLAGRLALLDSAGMRWSEMIVPRLPACSVCSSRPGSL